MDVFTNAETVVLMVANAATIIFFVAIMSPRKRQNNFYNMAKPLNELCSDNDGRNLRRSGAALSERSSRYVD